MSETSALATGRLGLACFSSCRARSRARITVATTNAATASPPRKPDNQIRRSCQEIMPGSEGRAWTRRRRSLASRSSPAAHCSETLWSRQHKAWLNGARYVPLARSLWLRHLQRPRLLSCKLLHVRGNSLSLVPAIRSFCRSWTRRLTSSPRASTLPSRAGVR